MTIDELVSFGFKEWSVNKDMDRHDRHWQYCRKDCVGKKFFVQVRLWAFSKYSKPNMEVKDTMDSFAQLKTKDGHVFHLELLCVDNMTPQQLVDWYNDVHTKLNCSYYSIWNDSYK
jgi:hypothetical protein